MSPAEPALSAVLRRDRIVALIALALLTLLAWAYLVWTHDRMNAMPNVPGMDDLPGMVMQPMAWTATQTALTFAMWAIMMVAMMLPSAAPMVLTYMQVARTANSVPFASALWFAGGYLLAWFGFSLVATGAQYQLDQAMQLTPTLALSSKAYTGVLLILAGLYQWTSLKDTCLTNCRAPIAFVQKHGGFRPQATASLRLGALHGLYCIGCCWILMALLFAGGVMNVAWIALLTLVVIGEKLVPGGRYLARAVGTAAIAAGLWLLV